MKTNASDLKPVLGILKEKGLRITSQRMLLLDALMHSDGHLTIYDIHTIFNQANNRIGIATIYRTISLLEKAGCVQSLTHPDGTVRYQLNKPGLRHPHLVCEQCGAVIDLGEELIGELAERVLAQYGYQVIKHKVQLPGLCRACAAGSASACPSHETTPYTSHKPTLACRTVDN